MKTKKKLTERKLVRKKPITKIPPNPEGEIVPLSQEREFVEVQYEANLELKNPIYKRSNQLMLIAVILGWALDFLFWKQRVGVNFSIFLILCVLGGGYWLLSNGLKPARNSLWLLVPFLFFTVFTSLRQEPLAVFLTFAFAFFSLGVFASSYQGGYWFRYGFGNYIYKFFLLSGDLLAGFAVFASKARRVQEENASDRGVFPVWGLLRGLAIALPIVACFGSLLAAGDIVFKEKLDDFLDLGNLTENIFRGILILIYAYLLAGSFIHSALKSRDENIAGEYKPTIKPFLGFTESAVILGSVAILFLMFVVVQFQYFFGGETNIGVEGYTYSQYARRGFNELITVAFFSLILLIVLSVVVRREKESQKRVFSGLNVSVVALVMIILISAYQRISLSIWWHGFSRLRLYPRIFLIWLGVLLLAVVVLELARRQRYFTFAFVLASIGFAVSITLFNIDAAIIQRNVYRAWHGRNLNVPHLASLSTDAVPVLVDEFLYANLPTSTRQGVGAIIACYIYYEDSPRISEHDWRSFNLSRWQAHEALDKVRPYLAGYVIRYNKYPVRIKTPSGATFDCRDYDAANDREN
jgi:hypothetical protein